MRDLILLALGAGLASAAPSNPARGVLGLTDIKPLGAAGPNAQLASRSLSGAQLGNFPDPSIIYGDGSWYAYSTSSGGKGIPVATSADGFTWTLSDTDALPNAGSWIDPSDTGIWAPDVNKNDDGTYVMYYAGKNNGGARCIGAATSSTAAGPYTPQDAPLVCDDAGGGAIDPAGYDDGTDRWLMWKVDGNSLGGATTCTGGPASGTYISTPIRMQRMARDALTLLDSATTILDNEGASNDGVVEAPTLWKVPGGDFVLFYSAHCYSSDDYDVEYAWSSTINGAYGDRGILFRTSDGIGIYGPGHSDIDPNGVNMIFHGRTAANDPSGIRELYSATLTINGRSISY